MKRIVILLAIITISISLKAQEIKTIFGGPRSSGGYGALENKFTTIRGQYANISGIYGGWYLNHRFLIGVAASASTNNMIVPDQFSVQPGTHMTYQYGQFGMINEYAFGSNKAFHINFNLFTGAGFTLQYQRYGKDAYAYNTQNNYDENWFFVMEPGVQLEMNLLRWMRLSPGVSYRMTYGSNGLGLSDSDLTNTSYSITLKFGKF